MKKERIPSCNVYGVEGLLLEQEVNGVKADAVFVAATGGRRRYERRDGKRWRSGRKTGGGRTLCERERANLCPIKMSRPSRSICLSRFVTTVFIRVDWSSKHYIRVQETKKNGDKQVCLR